MPSSKKAHQALIRLCQNSGSGPIYELGCGWGGLLITLAKQHPQRQLVGFEASLFPYLITKARLNWLKLANVEVRRENFLHADLTGAQLLVCYLYPKGMQQLAKKITHPTGQIDFVISNTFSLPGFSAERQITLNDLYSSPVYRYRLTES